MFKIIERLTNTTAKTIFWTVFLIVLVVFADYITGYEIAFTFFYLLPILLVTWRVGLKWGLIVSVICAILWLLNDSWFTGHSYSYPFVLYWNTLVGLSFFVLFTVLTSRIWSLIHRERRQSKLRSFMIHTVSHELNNALNGMGAGIFRLKKEGPTASFETLTKTLLLLENSRIQMSVYMNRLLKEARMENGSPTLDKTPLVLSELLREALTYMENLLKDKELKVETQITGDQPFFMGDRDALTLVISNLLANAIKYTPQNGRIAVEISHLGEPPDRIVFSMEDTGMGISLADINKINANLHHSADEQPRGKDPGFGLKVANDLLVLHESHLQISSEKGKGSRFLFELPIHMAVEP